MWRPCWLAVNFTIYGDLASCKFNLTSLSPTHNPSFFSNDNIEYRRIHPISRLENYSAPPNVSLSQLKTDFSLDGQVDDVRDQGPELWKGNIPALVVREM